MAKYSFIAYFLWLVLGFLGLHHFYLGRYRQGILWITSFSGLFGLGWLRDSYRIPTYVKDANEDVDFMEILLIKIRHSKRPGLCENWHRLVAQILFGAFYRGLIYSAIPWDSSVMNYAGFILPFGTAFGAYMVSNVGRQKSPFSYALFGAYLGEFLVGEPHLLRDQSSAALVAVVTMLFSTYGWSYRQEKESRSCCKTFLVILTVYALFVGLCCSFVYFNATIDTEDGETIKVRDAIDNFFNSPAWQQIKTALWDLIFDIYEAWKTEGFDKAYSKFVILADIDGEDRAYMELGLEPGAPFKEVKKCYRELAKEWHPDHHQVEGEKVKQEAQEKFMRYKDAYDVLEKIHKRRKKYGEEED